MNRETWLNELALKMAPRFEEIGFPVPAFRVAIGFTSRGKSPKIGGECWHKSNSADGKYEVLIAPSQDNAMDVAAILAHELSHAAAGFKHKHGGLFKKCVSELGLVRPFTSSVAGPVFKEWAQPFLDELGALPHAKLLYGSSAQIPREGGEDGEGEGEDEGGGSSNDKKKQSSRLLKACCKHDGCGYTVRLSRKWADKLGAVCPEHGPMDVEIPAGAMDDSAQDD